MNRRAFLGAAGTLVLAAGGYEFNRTSRRQPPDSTTANGIVNADTREPYITPTSDFYRIDTVLGDAPRIDPAEWTLRIHGMVDNERTITMDDISKLRQVENVITLGCVSNPVGGHEIGTAKWRGVLLADVLESVGIRSGAEQLVSRSADGWTCGTPVNAVLDGRPAMLATHMNDEPLPIKHGFPVRMVVPGLFGYVSATKWVTEIEVTTWDAFDAYWVTNGWAKKAPMLSSSRIDVPRTGAHIESGRETRVGGFAWAPRSGVRSVQVRVDGGEWSDASIGRADNGDTWAEWEWSWVPTPGRHELQVRCIDADGRAQDETVRPEVPSGATGLHSVTVRVR